QTRRMKWSLERAGSAGFLSSLVLEDAAASLCRYPYPREITGNLYQRNRWLGPSWSESISGCHVVIL
ncbi:mCG1046128, partial [Mus musculus]